MTYQNYEFTAYTEADFLSQGGNGSSIGRGDSFTLSGDPSVCISTRDNDGSLSGDSRRNENANDSSGQYARVDGARVGSQMYAESYHVLKDADGNKYYMIEVEIEGYNAPGAGDDFFTFYGDVPPAGVELTVVQTCNVKGCWVDYDCLGAGDKAPANTPPTFTNLPDDGIFCVDENTTLVIDVNSEDVDGDTVTYEIVGGRDAEFFEIDAETGELTFKSAPDYENPQSGGNNNTYDVTIKVSDGNGGSETKALWVKVKDVDESTPGECIVIEAETMELCNYRVEERGDASGGAGIKLTASKGYAKTTFSGADGEYDLTLTYMDESDGQGFIDIFVNGEFKFCVALNQDNNGDGIDGSSSWSTVTIEDLQLETGDVVTFKGRGNCSEFARIDKIELCQDGETCPEGYARLDFEGESAGTVVDTQFAGVTITAQRDTNNTAENDAMIFDSANPTGGDHDLATNSQGNILIISEDNDSSDPDDAVGGELCFDFDNPSDLHDIKLIDIEEAGGEIRLYDEAGDLIKTVSIPAAGNNSIQMVMLEATDVSKMVIDLAGSGAVDDLCWKPGEAPEPGSLSGTYFCDDDRDGVDDGAAAGDADVAGKLVTLLNADGTPANDNDGNPVAAVLTDAEGNYRFDNLAAGDYKVMFVGSDDKTFIAQDVGGDDTIDSDVDPATGMTGPVTVIAGEETMDVDAGVEYLPGSLSGRYFCDENDNDVDDGEPGIEGVTVELLDAAGNKTGASTTTGADGSYSFTGLAPGTYGVQFTDTVSGKTLVAANDPNGNGDDTNDSDATQVGDPVDGVSEITGIVVVANMDTPDNDAGVEDPGTASVGDTVWFDTNGNGVLDGAEVGADDVEVKLLNDAGVVVGTQTTQNGGQYLFNNLNAGTYSVMFGTLAGYGFTTEGAAADDDVNNDSDADLLTGMTDTFVLSIGEAERDIDAGLVKLNGDPEPQAAAAMTCADEAKTVDVLVNDVDPDGDPLTITMVDGQAISEGNSIVTAAGTIVTLSGGELVVDGEAAYAALDIGDQAIENISYKVEDGNGGAATANLEMIFCGDANTVDSFYASLPANGTYELTYAADEATPFPEFAFDLRFLDTGDARFDGVLFEAAYCLDFDTAVRTLADNGPDNTGDIFGSQSAAALGAFDPNTVSNANGLAGSENLDLINWVVAQDFEGQGFSGWEVQFAIWELADNFDASLVNYSAFADTELADVEQILNDALNQDGFEFSAQGTVGVIVDPGTSDPGNIQPFIVGLNWEDYDCLC